MDHLESLEAQLIDSIRSMVVCSKTTDISLQHIHPPVRFTVESCEYCSKYGNVYAQ